MKQLLGFLVPAAASAGSETFAQHLVIAALSGVLGVVGVTLAAYVGRARGERKRTEMLEEKLRPDHEPERSE